MCGWGSMLALMLGVWHQSVNFGAGCVTNPSTLSGTNPSTLERGGGAHRGALLALPRLALHLRLRLVQGSMDQGGV